MAPLTWRNVDAPSFSGVTDAYRLASQSMNAGFESLNKILTDVQDKRASTANNTIALEAMKLQDPEAYKAALASGRLTAGVDPSLVSKDTLNFLGSQTRNLLGDQQAGANLSGTGLRNEAQAFANDRNVVDAQRTDSQRAAMPQATARMAEIRDLARSGDPAKIEQARRMTVESADLFASAGITPDGTLAFMAGNDSAFAGGMNEEKAVDEFGDYNDSRVRGNHIRSLVEELRTSTATPQEAIRQAQGMGLDARTLQGVIGDITSNAGTYYPAVDPAQAALDRLTGASPLAPAGLINNESGGRLNAQNNEVGAGGVRGHYGRGQFGQARLQEAKNAGVIPADMTPEQFMQSAEGQRAVEDWHFSDIDQQAARNGLDKYYGQTINGVVISPESIRSMAHLGGFNGAKRFIETGGKYNPADSNGTTLKDYGMKFDGKAGSSSIGSAPVDPNRDIIRNPDGSVLTQETITFEDNGKFVNIPTIVEGMQVSEEEAIEFYKDGQNPAVGRFNTAEEAEGAAEQRTAEVNSLLAEAAGQTPTGAAPVAGATAVDPAAALSQTAAPTTQQAATVINQGANTLTNTVAVDRAFNPMAALDARIAERQGANSSKAQVVEQLKEGPLKDVPKTALTAAIDEIMSKAGVSADIAGVLAEQNLESRDLSNWFWWDGDAYGGPTEGNFAPRINTAKALQDAEAYRERNTNNISGGVGRQTLNQASASAPEKIAQLQQLAATVQARWEQTLATAQVNPTVAANIEMYKAQYEREMAAIQAELQKIDQSGVTTGFSAAMPTE